MISLFAPAVYPSLWRDFYGSLGTLDMEWEVIFIGPADPIAMWPNCRHIKTGVKPSQAGEIGLRACKGDLFMKFSDDIEFVTRNPLQEMVNFYRALKDKKKIITPQYHPALPYDPNQRVDISDRGSPFIPVCTLGNTEFIRSLGGVDRNFLAIYWDLDIAMRVVQAGGTVEMSDAAIKETRNSNSLSKRFGTQDYALFSDLWIDGGELGRGGKLRKERRRVVGSFDDTDLLAVSQGPKGIWE